MEDPRDAKSGSDKDEVKADQPKNNSNASRRGVLSGTLIAAMSAAALPLVVTRNAGGQSCPTDYVDMGLSLDPASDPGDCFDQCVTETSGCIEDAADNWDSTDAFDTGDPGMGGGGDPGGGGGGYDYYGYEY